MKIDDPGIRAAQWRGFICESPPEDVVGRLSECICDYHRRRSEEACGELILLAQVFADLLPEERFCARLHEYCACELEDERLNELTRAWFSTYPPSRMGLPHADAGNAQSLISQPLGVQKMHARLHQRNCQEALLYTPWPQVVEILCQNPTIKERDIIFMASRRPTRNALLEPILRSRWMARAEIRFALAANPYFNAGHAMRCAMSLPRPKLIELSRIPEIHEFVRRHARFLLDLWCEIPDRRYPPVDLSGALD